MKILLAVDGSAFTKKMLAYLTTHLDLFSGDIEYTALTVHGALPPRARAAVGREIVETYYAEEAAKVLDPVVKFLTRHQLNVKTLSKVGNAGELIAKTAESGKFDLIVMGSRGHGALGGLVMGSVATKVLASCEVPVLLVR
ncbi:MAG: universal stress protein [Rubrivivax sp.]|uniref:universal stress protein n=1 Tax=Ottowia sp. TaxID=1898956 RepID=UPI00217BF703|nr:universal stress protein [Ottowia sp.]MCC6812646.1 universal stress protein [Rubrivivax sp.]MCZ2090645.1 universal stress protein [Burkholderiales bacterium]HNE60674.1 universal stress protein [Ottowia sp.]HNJ45742.1 universal stress protein [Ottowia sp.]HNK53743.1 universal stress protein [Ottowia sp.]